MVFLVVAVLQGCRGYDKRTITISVPEMKNRECAQRIASALANKPGIGPENKFSVDIDTRTVTITYDSMLLAKKNIEFLIADAGFSANEVPANAEAVKALPPECR